MTSLNHSDANYSSARQSQLSSDRRMVKVRDDIAIKQFIEPVIKDFVKYLETMAIVSTKTITYDIFTPGKVLIDPAKEVRPKIAEVRGGLKSWSEAIRGRGKKPRKVAEQISKDYQLLDEYGLKIDTDSRRTDAEERTPNDNQGQEGNQGTSGDD